MPRQAPRWWFWFWNWLYVARLYLVLQLPWGYTVGQPTYEGNFIISKSYPTAFNSKFVGFDKFWSWPPESASTAPQIPKVGQSLQMHIFHSQNIPYNFYFVICLQKLKLVFGHTCTDRQTDVKVWLVIQIRHGKTKFNFSSRIYFKK